MGVPDDANPLNRRLPAEVVSRRRKVEKVEKEETPLATDRGQVLAMKAEHRLKWLSKALQKCHEGRIPVNTVFDIVTHAKFTSDANDKLGAKMYRAVRANLSLFSSKQQRYLQDDECKLVEMFKRTLRGGGDAADPAAGGVAAGSSGDADAPAEAPPKDFAGIAALWARMTQLSPLERAEAVEQLDAGTKELLEDFLEARIKRAQGSAEDGAAGADGQAAPLPQGSRSRSGGRSASSRGESRDGSRGRDGNRRSRSRSRSRAAAEKGRKARERSRSRSRSEARDKRGSEAKGSKRNRERDDDGRRGKKGKSRRGRSASGRRGRSSSGSPS